MATRADAEAGHIAEYPTNSIGYKDGSSHHRPGLFRHDSQPGFPVGRNRRIANPGPLGMFALAVTTLMWSLFNARARGITEVNGIVGMALAVGGLCQFLAGMWEFVVGNTFAATAFTLLGGFWISYGIFYWPTSGAQSGGDVESVIGIYFMVWMVVSLMLLLGTFRSSAPLAGTFFLLFLMYMLLGIASFRNSAGTRRAGGVVGCIASGLAFYTGAIGLHNRDTTYWDVPAIGLSSLRRNRDVADTHPADTRPADQ